MPAASVAGRSSSGCADGFDLFVGQAELIAGKPGPLLRHRDRHVAFEIEVRRRRAVEKASGDIDLGRDLLRDVTARRGEIELDAVGHVILDQERRLADRRPLRIGEGAHMPGPGRRRGRQRQSEAVAAQALVRHRGAAKLDAVGPLDNERQRHAKRRRALRIAQQRGEIGGLAGAIDAALGIDEGIETVRRRPAADAAVGEIEGRRFQAEEGIVALRIGRGEHGRRGTALPARQAGLELRVTAGIGAARGQHLVAARNQPHLDAALGSRSSPAN